MNALIEKSILKALFKATVEQMTIVKVTLSQRDKQIFNDWQKRGNRLLDSQEGKNKIVDEHVEGITDVLHDTIDEIRKQITPKG